MALSHYFYKNVVNSHLMKNFSTYKRIPQSNKPFTPQRVLVLTKISRYQIEKIREPSLDETLLKKRLLERGANYDAIIDAHHKNKQTELRTIEVLKQNNIEYKIIDRFSINSPTIDWADLILPIGGDGTFLLASNLIANNQKPIMGINSDPSSSTGRLMLPANYTDDVKTAFERLKLGMFKLLMRSRIRVVLHGENIWSQAFHLHDKGVVTSEERFYREDDTTDSCESLTLERRLPWLALNEVFVGESHSARTSSLLFNTDEHEDMYYKTKSSGLCVSTGTGSTSWHHVINSIDVRTVREIFEIAKTDAFFSNDQIEQIVRSYNNNLQFPPDDSRLSYSIRDMIRQKHVTFPKNMYSRGFCKKLSVRSLCFDAGLVLDGGIAVPFNAGTAARLEVHPEDSLRCIVMD